MKSILHRRTNKSRVLLNPTHGFALPASGAFPGPWPGLLSILLRGAQNISRWSLWLPTVSEHLENTISIKPSPLLLSQTTSPSRILHISQLYNSSFQGSWVILHNLPCGCMWDREIIWLQSLSLAGVLKPIKAVSQGGRTRSLQNSLELRAVSTLHYWNLYYNKGQASF